MTTVRELNLHQLQQIGRDHAADITASIHNVSHRVPDTLHRLVTCLDCGAAVLAQIHPASDDDNVIVHYLHHHPELLERANGNT